MAAVARRCQKILDSEGVKAACEHHINPSGIVYQPSTGKLFVIGQEYILHLSERRSDNSGGYEFEVDGCHKGADLSLGRGDNEGVTTLDFDLPEPSRLETRRYRNWLILSRLRRYILMMEENYQIPVAYLVDTALLRKGYTHSSIPTRGVFTIPRSSYPDQLEGLAFVPDLDDDIYLGTLFMGSQRGLVYSCKLPLADWSLPTICSDVPSKFSIRIDSMEYGELQHRRMKGTCHLMVY